MKMMRTLTVLLCISLLLSSCGGKKEKQNETSGADVTSDGGTALESAETSGVVSGQEQSDERKDGLIIGADDLSMPSFTPEGYINDVDNFAIIEGYHSVGIYKYNGTATKLIIPAQINGKPVDKIYADCFSAQTKLEGVYIEDGIKEIGNKAFYKCIKLKEVKLPNTLESIGYSAFYECISLKEVYVPDSVNRISVNGFYGCVSLKSVRLPAEIKHIYTCFSGCTSLSGTAIIPACGSVIYPVYFGCKGIRTLIIKGGEVVKSDTFEGMTGLEEVHIPESVIQLEGIDRLFADCVSLKQIYVVDGSYAAYALADTVWGKYLCSEVSNG